MPPIHPHPPRKAYVETYGCQMNISDGELMEGILAASGFAVAHRPEDADLILVNTCAIREHAEQRVLGRVGELNRLKKDRPELVIGVTGCMAQRLGVRLLEQAGHVDLVMGPDGYRKLPEVLATVRPGLLGPPVHRGTPDADGALQAPALVGTTPPAASGGRPGGRELPVLPPSALATGSPVAGPPTVPTVAPAAPVPVDPATAPWERAAVLELEPHENYEGLEVRRTTGSISAWVPIQRGCNYRCTYCIVPYVRGSEKNRAPERVLDEVRSLAEQGVVEVTLLGQTVNSYAHGDWDFPRLLRAVARVDGIRRVRFTSPHPNDVTTGLIEVMAAEPEVCNQLHLPVQSGHDRTLKRMVRRYTVARYMEIVDEVRRAIPDIALSTDVIVGFAGETDEEYAATLDLMREVRFDDAYLYKYSQREGTPATRLPASEFVPDEVGQARLERLIQVQRAIQAEINGGEVGRVEEVLIERMARSEGDVLGRTERNKVVAFPGERSLIGSFAHVRLQRTTGATFIGTRVGGRETRVA
jgi:tRNA-2-methylthio-N6-dimethylallyladenosine synthase